MHEHPIRVLVVDDEPLIRWAITETLVARGCDVVGADDARSATDALSKASERFDVVVLDYRLPDTHGLGLLETAHRLSPHSQLVLMSAFITEDVASQAVRLGACHVLQKPVDVHALAALVLQAAGVPIVTAAAPRGTH